MAETEQTKESGVDRWADLADGDESYLDWRSASPHVPASFYPLNPGDENCLGHTERLVAANPELRQAMGYAKGNDGTWGAHTWAVSPKGEIVDPYFEWRFPNTQYEYREAEQGKS